MNTKHISYEVYILHSIKLQIAQKKFTKTQ